MASTKEVEVKFLVRDVRGLQRKLREAGFRLMTPRTHEMNVLYDTQDRRLRETGQLLRIRKYGKKWTLTHKTPTLPLRFAQGQGGAPKFPTIRGAQGGTPGKGRHKTRVETESEIADGVKLEAIFRALGFTPTFRYEKFRSEWTDGKGEVVVDETPIGNVAEIEGPPRWIDRTARTLGVSRAEYITKNYAQMFEEWKQRTGSKAKEMTFAAVRKRPGRTKR
ncbi:MAG: class IV adenylate cyclase [Terriglobales bacterium]